MLDSKLLKPIKKLFCIKFAQTIDINKVNEYFRAKTMH